MQGVVRVVRGKKKGLRQMEFHRERERLRPPASGERKRESQH